MRRLHNQKLCDLYSSPNIIRIIKSRRLGWLHGTRGAYRLVVGRPNGKGPLGRPRSRQEGNIKMDLQKVGFGAWTGLIWLRLCRRSGRL